MDYTNVIIRPLITEKSARQHQSGNVYAFEVHPESNKDQIRLAIEKLYSVKVVDVRTLTRRGKPRRTKTRMTTTSSWKRAMVVLDENSKIELF